MRSLAFLPCLLGQLLVAQVPTPAARVAAREFPSVFQAWNGAAPAPGTTALEREAWHDLLFTHPTAFGLRSEAAHEGLSPPFTAASVAKAKDKRGSLLALNPRMVLLAEVRYRDAPQTFLPGDSPFWKRDANGAFAMGWAEGGYRLLDVSQPGWHDLVASRARTVMATGAFDGVMLDWWRDDPARLELLRKVREAVGPDALILVNANDEKIPLSAPLVNGLFMECYRTKTPKDWERLSETLHWAEASLRPPRVNCLETWFHQSRQDLALMRSVTTLSLTQSDGYCLFSDPNNLPTPDHQHDWYPFWQKGLGKPAGPGQQRPDGLWVRGFSRGSAVHNPPGGKPATISFPTPRLSRATGKLAAEHTISPGDGDLLLVP